METYSVDVPDCKLFRHSDFFPKTRRELSDLLAKQIPLDSQLGQHLSGDRTQSVPELPVTAVKIRQNNLSFLEQHRTSELRSSYPYPARSCTLSRPTHHVTEYALHRNIVDGIAIKYRQPPKTGVGPRNAAYTFGRYRILVSATYL